ncbi:RNI-like protein [Myriangium duriaei CBS 260.36]|uniref:RNI-like protein n=1 Tax=Myriangium duriaei CBS 260.36 TaxID=1168546 RepID=A0A9P4J1K7_9PEZI|nr:RNI-like protein [Myriangium duriaei CBS 260.36]
MSGRRAGNRIRGPQSALTDFLAANNISAAQIRDDYDRRQREAEQQARENGEGPSTTAQSAEDADAEMAEAIAAAEQAAENTKKRKRNEKDAIEKIKNAKKKKQKSKKDPGSEDEYDDVLGRYEKAKPMPGQFEHCELCSKRFTVTPYSKEGPEGGLLCTPCGKQMTKDLKAEEKAKQKKPAAGRKRRQNESNRLDGIASNKVKTLQQLCIEKAVQFHDDVEELGDLPQELMDRLSAIFSKKRVMNSKTIKLFIRPDVDTIAIHDAAYLEVDDYMQMFAVSPGIRKLVIRNACQLKDEAIEYMLEKCDNINYLQLYAANLISDGMWLKLFKRYGKQLETFKLNWLDATFGDDIAAAMVKNCPNIRRLKLKLCRRLGQATIETISKLKHLEHLSLQISSEVSPESLVNLVQKCGANLRTLSLEHFLDLDDTVLSAIHINCKNISKMRISENDTATDAGFAALFSHWENPPLKFANFNSTRDVDNNNPTGPEEAIGVADAGFKALMKHSGFALEDLNIASCRHVSLSTFNDVFDGEAIYPALERIDMSFCSRVDTRVIAGIFKSCPAVKKVIAFGCFDVQDVVVPRDVVLIGVPKAQDAIEQFGMGMGVEEAVTRMVGVAA